MSSANESVYSIKLVTGGFLSSAKAAAQALFGINKAVEAVNKATGGEGARRRMRKPASGLLSDVSAALPAEVKAAKKEKKEKKNDGLNAAADKIDSLAGSLATAAKYSAVLYGGMAAAAAVSFTKSVVDMASYAEATKMAFVNLTGNDDAWKVSKDLAMNYGLGIKDTADQMKKLLAAQFKLGEATDLIKLTTDLRSIGSTAQQTGNAIMAITQIKAKGKLQAEELVGQLAEAGVATTLVYKALASQMGKTEAEVKDMLKNGKIDADTGIKAIKAAILAKAHIHEAGDAGKAFAGATLKGMLETLGNAPERLFMKVAEASDFIVPQVKAMANAIAQMFKDLDTFTLSRFVGSMLDLATIALPLSIEMIKGFMSGMDGIVKAITGAESIEITKDKFFEFGKSLAKIVELGVKALGILVELANWCTSDAGQVVVGILAMATAMFRLVMALGAVQAFFTGAGAAGTLAGAGTFAAGLGLILNPIGLLVATLVVALGALWYFQDELKAWSEGWDAAFNKMGDDADVAAVAEIAPAQVSEGDLARMFSAGGGAANIDVGGIVINGASTDSPEEFAKRVRDELMRTMAGAHESHTGA